MFYQKIDKRSNKEMFNFIVGHYRYFTMNPWNRLTSIANNVKLYTLDLENIDKAYEIITTDEFWLQVTFIIQEFLDSHKDYDVYFNGRSQGYLVLTNKQNNKSVIDEDIYGYDNFEDYEEDMLNIGHTKRSLSEHLKTYVDLISDFDMLTDEIRNYLIYACEEYNVVDIEYPVVKTKPTLMAKDIE